MNLLAKQFAATMFSGGKMLLMKNFRMYVDESGSPDLSHPDRNFTLCGILVDDYQSEDLKIRADQVKFKYWNTTEIVFHSHDIGMKKGPFSIFSDLSKYASFQKDLFMFLHATGYRIIVVSINKDSARALNWTTEKILDTANEILIETFLGFLSYGGYKGQIIMESSTVKDIAFYKRYAQYLSHGFPRSRFPHGFQVLNLNPDQVKKTLTALSFVSKDNYDIEAQLADLYAYVASCKFSHDDGIKTLIPGSYEHKLCRIMNGKIAAIGVGKGLARLP